MTEPKKTITMPWSPEEFKQLSAERVAQWDEWYARLPADLRRKLSLHDFKRLGDLFKEVFKIQ